MNHNSDLKPAPDLPTNRWPPRTLWLATLMMLTLVWVHVYQQSQGLKTQAFETAKNSLTDLTRVTQEHAIRTFHGADQALQFIRARYRAEGKKLDLQGLVAQGVIDAALFPQIGIVDAGGRLVLSNIPFDKDLDLSDRSFFEWHQANDHQDLTISEPMLGRASGKWAIQLTRRINATDGRFAGVAFVSIEVVYFSHFYADLSRDPDDLTVLLGLDGRIKIRQAGTQTSFGENAQASAAVQLTLQGQHQGFYTTRSVVDGVERLYSYKKIPDYPLITLKGISMSDLRATYEPARNALLQQGVVMSLLLIAMAFAMRQYTVRLQRNLAERQQAAEEQRIAKEQVMDRTAQLDVIFSLSPDAFVSFDSSRHVKYVNPSFTRITGLSQADVNQLDEDAFSARLAAVCLPVKPFRGVTTLRQEATALKQAPNELIELSNPGRCVLKVILKISSSASVSHILYLRDVSHETIVEDMKTEFLATAAHELRTPLASVLGFAEVLLQQELDKPTQQEFLNIILTQTQNLASILDELLDLARIEARQGKDFMFQTVELKALVQDLVNNFIPPKGRSAPQVTLPVTYCRADRGKAKQAILNVLSNAYKYSAPGTDISITATATEAPALTGILVRDQGIGMNAAQQARVFERFYRADTSGAVPGTGLGMSIVKEIMELHGGAVTLQSAPSSGTAVTLLFQGAEVDQNVPG